MIENFESNLILAKCTLPGLIIYIMHNENCPVTESQLINEISSKFEDLRKVNGYKYNVIHQILFNRVISIKY